MMAEIAGLKNINIFENKPVNWTRQSDVRDLILHSLRADFPTRTHTEIALLMEEVGYQRVNLNRAVGGPLLKRRQSYRKLVEVVAVKDDKPIALVSSANNASTRRPLPIGPVERFAKHHLDRLIGNRWAWYGLSAIDPSLKGYMAESLSSADGPASILDVLGYIALDKHDLRQPVSAFPWQGEDNWEETIARWGLRPRTQQDPETDDWVRITDPIYAFGRYHEPVNQEWHTADNVHRVRENIMALQGARRAVGQAEAILATNL